MIAWGKRKKKKKEGEETRSHLKLGPGGILGDA
jgi:hypothetical protein